MRELDLAELTVRATAAAQAWAPGCELVDLRSIEGGTIGLVYSARVVDGPPEVRRAVGYVPESTELLPYLTVAEVVRVAATLRGAGEPAPELLERLGVQDFLHQRIASLSLGQRRRGLILAGLVGDPGLLLLDEPTNGLDPPAVEMLGRLIRDLVAEGRMVLFVTHDLGLVEAAGAEVLRLEAGVLRAPLSSHG